MVKPLEKVDHIEQSKANYLSQYVELPNFTALIDSLMTGLEDVEDMFDTWAEKLNLDTATGINLDYWGEILDADSFLSGIKRPANDDVYRAMLYAIAGAYTSDGSCQAIANIVLSILQADGVFIDDNEDATFSFEVDNPKFLFGKDFISALINLSKPVGVEFIGYTVTNVYGEPTFGFYEDEDKNILGFAVLANIDVTTGFWENYHCAAAGEISTTERIVTEIDTELLTADFTIIQPKNFDKELTISYEREDVEMGNPPSAAIYSWDGSTLGSAVEWTWQWNNTNKYLQINTIDGGTDYANYRNFIPSDLYGAATQELIDANGNVWTFTYPFRLSGSSSQPRSFSSQSTITFNGEPYDSSLDYPEVPTTVPADGTGARYVNQETQIDTYWPGSPSDDFSYVGIKNYYSMDTSSRQYEVLYQSLENLEDGSDVFIDNFKITESFGWQTTGSTNDPSVVNMRINQPVTFTFDTAEEGFSKLGNLPKLNTPYAATEFLWLEFQPDQFLSGSNTTKYTLKFSQFEYLSEDTLQFTISSVCKYTGVYDPLTTALIGMTKTEELDPADPDLYLSWRYGDIPRLLEYTDVAIGEVSTLVSQYDTMTLKQCETTLNNGIIWFKPITWEFQGIEYSQETFPISLTYGAGNFTVGSIDIKKPDEVQIIPTDGEAFVDDIMNDFNGVIGSKIGYEFSFYNLPIAEDDPVEIGSLPNFAFQTSGGLGQADGSDIPAAIEPQVNNDFDDSKSIAFYGDETFLSTLESDVVSNFNQTNVLTIFDKNNNRFDIERLTASDSSLIQVDNAYAVTANGLINTTLDMSYCLPSPTFDPFSFEEFLNLNNGFIGQFQGATTIGAGTITFQLYDNNKVNQFQQLMSDFIEHEGRELSMVGREGAVVKLTNLVAGSGSDTGRLQSTLLDGNPSKIRTNFELLLGQHLVSPPGLAYIKVEIDGVDYTEWAYKGSGNQYPGTDSSNDPLEYKARSEGPPNFDDEPYSAFYPIFVANNQYSVEYRNLPAYSNTEGTGFPSNRQGVGLVIYDNGLNTINCRTYFNGIKVSAASFLSRFSGFNKNESSDFSSSNPTGLKIYDKPLPFNRSAGNYVKYPYLFMQDQYNNDGFNENRILYFDNGSLDIIMNIGDYDDLRLVLKEKFQDNILPGNNICVTDKAGVKWKIQVPDDFVNDSGDGSPYLTFNGRRIAANGGPAFNLDKQGAGFDNIEIFASKNRSSTPNSWFFDVYRDGVLLPPDVDTGDDDEPEWYFTPYGIGDDEIFAQNNPNGLTEELPEQKIQWLMENLSTFDIVEVTDDNGSDYWKIKINMSSLGNDNVVLFNNNQPQVIMGLTNEQLSELNVSEPTVIPYLIKETTESDGAIPEVGYALKGGGRLSLNQ